MRREADATVIAIAPSDSVERAAERAPEDAAFVIAVTRNISTRMQLVRRLPADTVVLLAPDRASAEWALRAGAPRTVKDELEHSPITCGGMVVDPQRQR